MTVKEFLKETKEKFIHAGIASARLDAEIILSHVLGVERHRLLLNEDRVLTGEETLMLLDFSKRRISGEPVAYLTGIKEFYSLEFNVNRDVLIPRPETELLVDLVLFYSGKNSIILDLGTGCGAIAAALRQNRPDLYIIASDISLPALLVARSNSERLPGKNQIRFLCGDLLSTFKPRIFDIIVSNPPYLDPAARETLQRELSYEPALALFSDNSGRADILNIIRDGRNIIKPGGIILTEMSPEMDGFVHEAGREAGFSVSVFNDYSNMPRVAVFQ